MKEIYMKATSVSLVPVDLDGWEKLEEVNGYTVKVKLQKSRNPKFHAKFFALLRLAYDYWEPAGGLIQDCERKAIKGFVKWLTLQIRGIESYTTVTDEYLRKIEIERGERYPSISKSFEAFKDWIIIESGNYELYMTPTGIKKMATSISFSSMDELQFQELYGAVFNVAWRQILGKTFESEQAAQSAIDRINDFG